MPNPSLKRNDKTPIYTFPIRTQTPNILIRETYTPRLSYLFETNKTACITKADNQDSQQDFCFRK